MWEQVAGVAGCTHPKGFALIKHSRPDFILRIQEAEWVTRERVCFHAAGLTSALEVHKPPSLRPADNLGAATLILHVFEGKVGAGEEPRTLEELGAQL